MSISPIVNRTRLSTPHVPGSPLLSDPSLSASRMSLVNLKLVMAVTGASLLLFVAVHMLGNLQIYLGQDALNAYARKLKSMPLLVWTARAGLLLTFSLHLAVAVYLKRRNRLARPQRYVINDPVETTLASRTMLTSGLVILSFLIYHLLHFTLGLTDTSSHRLVDAEGRHDVYSMVVLSFQNAYVSTAYIVAMLFLGLHLCHASSSIFQTLGIVKGSSRQLFHRIGVGIALIIVIGNISIPLAVLLGIVGLPIEVVRP